MESPSNITTPETISQGLEIEKEDSRDSADSTGHPYGNTSRSIEGGTYRYSNCPSKIMYYGYSIGLFWVF